MQSFDTLHQTNDAVNTHIQIATGVSHGFNMTMQQPLMTGFTATSHTIKPDDHKVNVAAIGGQ